MHFHTHTRRAAPEPRTASATPRHRNRTKRSIDVVVSAMALLLLSVLMFAVAAMIRLTSRGPALFRQTRMGLHQKPFVMYKFRTMRDGCSDETHRAFVSLLLAEEVAAIDGLYKLSHDPRITGLGAVLRRTSLDELPQLFNVLRGEMSLVGPRPALPWEMEMFPAFSQPRFDVTPGLTGLWQVSGRNRLTMLEGLELDVQYVMQQSTWQDLKILVQTVPTLIRRGAR
jgi:lipopolysaccharide/colanic/teichoic acid biosynthesis glycosyltransferase